MKKIFVILLLTFICNVLFSQVEINIVVMKEDKSFYNFSYYVINNKYYRIFEKKLCEINISNMEIIKVKEVIDWNIEYYPMCGYNDKLFYKDYIDNESKIDFGIFDLKSKSFNIIISENLGSSLLQHAIYYQNDVFFYISMIDSGPGFLKGNLATINIKTNKQSIFQEINTDGSLGFIDISSDKNTLICAPNIIIDTNTKNISLITNSDIEIQNFITNDLILCRSYYNWDKKNWDWYIANINGEIIEKIDFNIIKDNVKISFDDYEATGQKSIPLNIKLFNNLNYGILKYAPSHYVNRICYIIETTELKKYLMNKGLLFVETKGRINETNVLIRENPNLNAKKLGEHNLGDIVMLLERSGKKMKIGKMEAYWYKVKSIDGTIGWTYGFFIDFIK